jgi:signal transduction histidine kinase
MNPPDGAGGTGAARVARHVAVHRVAVAALGATTAVATVVADPSGRPVASGAGLALVALQLVLGRRVARAEAADASVAIYLAALVAGWTVASLAWPGWLWLAFVVFWQCWSLVPSPLVYGPPAVVTVLLVLVQRSWGASWTLAVVSGSVSYLFGALLTAWIGEVLGHSERQRLLLEELARTRGELADASRAAGVAAERERLAREIHDTLAQGFTSIVMLMQAADAALAEDGPVRRYVRSAEQTARDNLAEARTLVAALEPDLLRRDGLPGALGRLADRLAAETGVQASLHVDGVPEPLGAPVEVALLRAVQEALSNVRKHAGARSVSVRLVYGDEATSVEVADDGVGFDPVSCAGFGLRGMRARLEELDGTVAVESAAGAGTTVRAVVAR